VSKWSPAGSMWTIGRRQASGSPPGSSRADASDLPGFSVQDPLLSVRSVGVLRGDQMPLVRGEPLAGPSIQDQWSLGGLGEVEEIGVVVGRLVRRPQGGKLPVILHEADERRVRVLDVADVPAVRAVAVLHPG